MHRFPHRIAFDLSPHRRHQSEVRNIFLVGTCHPRCCPEKRRRSPQSATHSDAREAALPRRRVASANCSVVTSVRVVMAPRTSRGGPRWPDRSALVLLGVILAGVCLTGADSYAVLPVNHLTPEDFLAVPSTCDGVELTNPTFPAANASVVYKEFSPDSGASVCHIFTCLRLCRSLGFFKHRASARSRSRVTRVPARASPAQTPRRGRAGTRVASPAVATRGLDPAGDSPPRGPSTPV